MPLFSSDLMIDDLCTHGYHLIDNFLLEEQVEELRRIAQQSQQQGAFQQAKIGRTVLTQQNATIRRDDICWLDQFNEHQSVQIFLKKMQDVRQALNQSLFLSLHEFETHFAIYQPGAFYKKHVDQFKTTSNRIISCVYYLNEAWQPEFGGQLKIYSIEDDLLQEVVPLKNRFICFRSELPHEVALTKHTRYSIAGWMKTR